MTGHRTLALDDAAVARLGERHGLHGPQALANHLRVPAEALAAAHSYPLEVTRGLLDRILSAFPTAAPADIVVALTPTEVARRIDTAIATAVLLAVRHDGRTIAALATQVDMSSDALSRRIHGHVPFAASELMLTATVLGLPVDHFLRPHLTPSAHQSEETPA